jgi:SlyX protein
MKQLLPTCKEKQMSKPSDLASRVAELEIEASYQHEAITSLSETISKQWTEIDRLTKDLKRLTDRLKSSEESASIPLGDEPPPPHY